MAKNPLLAQEVTLVKAPHQKIALTKEHQAEFIRCAIDPVYFANNYVYVQHPTRGKVPFKLFDYQIDMISTYNNHRQVIAMCSRQLGKCVISNTEITHDKENIEIGSLIKLSLKQRIVDRLERFLIKLSQMK
jgi:hypothetical protein